MRAMTGKEWIQVSGTSHVLFLEGIGYCQLPYKQSSSKSETCQLHLASCWKVWFVRVAISNTSTAMKTPRKVID